MTLEELASDLTFNPDTTGLVGDYKPWNGAGGKTPGGRIKAKRRTLCVVWGCAVAYAPAGVCGYCRGRVKAIRKEQGILAALAAEKAKEEAAA